MALITPSASPAISGSVGGTTYSRNRYGLYIRARSIPVNPQSIRQGAIRAFFSLLTSAWHNLSDANRAGWQLYADNTPRTNRVGSPIILSANAAYMGANMIRKEAGLDTIDTPPTELTLGTFTPPGTISLGGSTITMTGLASTDPWMTTDGAMIVYASDPKNPSVNFCKGPYKRAAAVLGQNASTTMNIVASNLSDNPPTAGQKVFIRVITTDPTGRPSAQWTTALTA